MTCMYIIHVHMNVLVNIYIILNIQVLDGTYMYLDLVIFTVTAGGYMWYMNVHHTCILYSHAPASSRT